MDLVGGIAKQAYNKSKMYVALIQDMDQKYTTAFVPSFKADCCDEKGLENLL